MRLFRISLAVKYRILFGLAVLLTTAAALAIPWYRMGALVHEQPFREAQRAVDDYFRLVLTVPGHAPAGGELHGQESSLLTGQALIRPKFHRYTPDASRPDSVVNNDGSDKFLNDATRTFLLHPKTRFLYVTDQGPTGTVFRYAHAVRVSRSCLACHDRGKTATPFREHDLAGFIQVDVPADQTEQYLLFNHLWLIFAGALAGILAILVFYIITHRFILAPIQELRAVATAVAEGDLDRRSDVQTGDEFEQLSDRMNFMLERLRESQQELKHANKLLDQKLGEMAETNVSLFESNRLKSEFLANVSHELRTPLTSIIGFAELLKDNAQQGTSEKGTRYADNILISGRILLEIINDLLDLAKIEAGKVDLNLEPVRIAEVCGTLVDFTKPLADAKKLWVVFEPEPDLPLLITDKGRLRQILYNLLSNAIKFTPEHGRITIRAQRDGDEHVQLSVRDTGPGIRPEDHQKIFEKFRQADQSATREHEGTGLGLTIAKQLTGLLGGEIGVESELEKGATFWVRLPIATTEPIDPPAVSLI